MFRLAGNSKVLEAIPTGAIIYKEHEKEKQYDAYREHDFYDEYGIYRHCFDVPDTWKGKQISIVFEGVMTDAEVKINDVIAGPVHQGSFYRFLMISRTDWKFGKTNLMEVTVKKQSAINQLMQASARADWWLSEVSIVLYIRRQSLARK